MANRNDPINVLEVGLYVAGTRFRAVLCHEPPRVTVQSLFLESGELIPWEVASFESDDAAKDAARDAVAKWLEKR